MAANPSTPQRLVPKTYRDKFASATGIQSNGTATIAVPRGLTYYQFHLAFKTATGVQTQTQMEAEVSNVRILVDGETFWSGKVAEFLDIVQTYYGSARGADIIDGYLTLDLAEMLSLKSPLDVRQMAWGTENVGQIVIELDTLTLTTLTGIDFYAVYDQERRPLGLHKKILPYAQNKTNTGTDEISDLPKKPSSAWRAAHITHGAGAISKLSFIADNVNYYKEIPQTLVQRDVEMAGRTQVSGYTHIDFNPNNEIFGFLPMTENGRAVGDLRVTPDFSTAPGNYRVLLETIEGF